MQIGQEIGVPADGEKTFRKQNIGLTLKCRPTVNGQSLKLEVGFRQTKLGTSCLLYTSDAADDFAVVWVWGVAG